MRRIVKWAVMGAMAAAMAGCTAIRVSHVGKSMVEVENNGWLLLDFIPIASGDADNPESKICNLFENSVTLDNNIDLINYAIRREGAIGVRDLVTYTTDEHVLFILLKRHCMHTSAVLVMPGEEELLDTNSIHRVESKRERDPEGTEVAKPPRTLLRPLRKNPPRNEPLDSRPPEPTKIELINF